MNDMVKTILFITHEDDKYGAAKSFMTIVKNLDKRQFRPVLISCKHNNYNEECDRLKIDNYVIPYVRCTTNENTSIFKFIVKKIRMYMINQLALIRLAKIVRKECVDLIHSNTSVIDIGMYLSNKLHIPHVWHIREFLDEDFSQVFLSSNQIDKINNSDSYMLYISKAIQSHWTLKGITNSGQVIYNGIAQNGLLDLENKPDHDFVRIVFSGHITPNKGQVQLIDALALLDKSLLDNVRVDIFGTGEEYYLNFLKKKLEDNKLDEIVCFQGFSNNLKSILPTYDIGVVCSKAEGFGRVTVEYMLAGLCVIASNTGANMEILEDNISGLQYTYGDIEDLAKKIEYLVENKAKRQELSKFGFTRAVSKFSENKYISNCHSVYMRLINDN